MNRSAILDLMRKESESLLLRLQAANDPMEFATVAEDVQEFLMATQPQEIIQALTAKMRTITSVGET